MKSGPYCVGVLLATVIAVGGCSTSGSDVVTLAETKSPAQLLRNEVANRVPAETIAGDAEQSDKSESCDSDGLVRSWRSSAEFALVSTASDEVERITSELVETFVDQGWAASTREASSRLFEHRLTSDTSSADVRITGNAGDDGGEGASLLIVVNGPCVHTDGPDSDEVKELEGRS